MPACVCVTLCSPGWHQPLPKYVQVLTDAVEGLRAIGINNIMLMTPPPVGIRHPTGPVSLHCMACRNLRAFKQNVSLCQPGSGCYNASVRAEPANLADICPSPTGIWHSRSFVALSASKLLAVGSTVANVMSCIFKDLERMPSCLMLGQHCCVEHDTQHELLPGRAPVRLPAVARSLL